MNAAIIFPSDQISCNTEARRTQRVSTVVMCPLFWQEHGILPFPGVIDSQ